MKTAPSRIFTASWMALLITGLAIFGFGLLQALLPSASLEERAIGVASIGMGLFGSVIVVTGFRGRQRWAWWSLWYYPIFWTAHLVGGLPPGQDHIHQVVFIVLSAGALVATMSEFLG